MERLLAAEGGSQERDAVSHGGGRWTGKTAAPRRHQGGEKWTPLCPGDECSRFPRLCSGGRLGWWWVLNVPREIFGFSARKSVGEIPRYKLMQTIVKDLLYVS